MNHLADTILFLQKYKKRIIWNSFLLFHIGLCCNLQENIIGKIELERMNLEEKDKLKHENITPPSDYIEFLNTKRGVLCVPEQKFRDYAGTVLQPETFRFAKWFTQNHPEIAIDVHEADARADLRSNDFWLPFVFLAADVSLQIYLNIVANYIYDMARGSLKHDKKSVHLKTIHKSSETGEIKEFTYDGSVKGFKALIKKFDLNKFMDK